MKAFLTSKPSIKPASTQLMGNCAQSQWGYAPSITVGCYQPSLPLNAAHLGWFNHLR